MKENQNEENLLIKKKPEQLSRTKRVFIFLILYILSIIIRASEHIKKELQDQQFKNIIYICYALGLLLGYTLYIKLFQIENMKKVTFICFLIYGLLFFVYPLTNNKYIFYCIRFLMYTFKNYKDVFIPIWIDQFGIKKYKTLFMIMHINFFFGGIFQSIFESILSQNQWYINCIIIGILIIIFDCLLLIFQNQYFSWKYYFIGYQSDKKDEFIKINKTGKPSFFKEENEDINNPGFIKTVIKNKVYIFSTFSLFFQHFVYKIITLSIYDYVVDSNYFSDRNKYNIISSKKMISSFGKFLGIIFELIYLCCIGGYENEKSAILFCISSILTFFSSIMILFSFNSFIFCTGFFFYLFSAIPLSFINKCFIINCLPNKYKGAGLSLSMILSTLGFWWSLTFYGLMHDIFDKYNKTIAWKINFILIISQIIFSLLSSYYRYYNIENNDEIKEDAAKELELIV